MESFKLGVLGLSEPEQSLVATLFRLHRVDPSFIWTLTSAPPFDALLVDASVPARSHVQSVGPRTKVKRLGLPGTTNPGEMPRPIRSDLLVGWLTSIEAGLLQEARRAAPPTGLPDPLAGPKMATSTEASPMNPETGSHKAIPVTALPVDNMVFKLKRWPPAGVMARDVGRIRMATLLSRKTMSLSELTMLSRMPDSVCLHFLRELDAQGLLETTSLQKPLTIHRHAHKTEPGLPARARPGVASSLIHSIRRRFGIG
jgi:hypothetical protein